MLEASCPQLPTPNFGERRGVCHQNAPINSICFFSCAEGWLLKGSKTLMCKETGMWNGSIPTCKKITSSPKLIPCPGLNPIQFGSQEGACNPGIPGKECKFTCSKGYYLVGTPVLKCGINGDWGGSAPSCIS